MVPGIRRRLEDHQPALVEDPGELAGGIDQVARGPARGGLRAEWERRSRSRRRRPAPDTRRVAVNRSATASSRSERDVLDVRLAAAKARNASLVRVDAHHLAAGLREGDRERQPDVAEPDDPYLHRAQRLVLRRGLGRLLAARAANRSPLHLASAASARCSIRRALSSERPSSRSPPALGVVDRADGDEHLRRHEERREAEVRRVGSTTRSTLSASNRLSNALSAAASLRDLPAVRARDAPRAGRSTRPPAPLPGRS